MTTPIRLPSNLPFPVTIAKLCVSTGDSVKKGQRLFVYKYWELQDIITAPNEEAPKKKRRVDLIGTFDSPVEGTLVSLNIGLGDEFVNDANVIAEVSQLCSHEVTYGGLCVVCGKTVEEDDQSAPDNGFSNSKLTVAHNNTNIKVSERQAATIEKTAQKHLRKHKKLVLVVDLDQTVIHCGVDPTIQEWANDPSNPNYDALKNVKTFSLDEDPILPPFYMGPRPPPRKCQYYVKLRPGLQEFFDKIAPHFELHIYTMATRAYALEIAKIIDPAGELFGDRILSRDENGSLTHKSLERLFPMDQSMVVIIDDRGDVWSWCENLIKVVPYNFFVGVGDINSNFLPRQQNSMLHLGRRNRKKAEEEELITDIMDTEKKLQEKIDQEVKKQEEKFNKINEENQPERPISKEDLTKKLEHNASLEVQQQNRPLAELQKHMNNQKLLIDDDDELPHLSNILLSVHKTYYDKLAEQGQPPDIKKLMPEMKSRVFEGCHFVFSGLIPLGTNVRQADIVLWTNMFGAKTSVDVDEYTTHVITKTPGTFKARLAKTFNPNIRVIHPDWIFECLVKWARVNEKPYELITEQDVSPEELEEFKKRLDKKKQSEQALSESVQQEAAQELNLLTGNDLWLDNDDDEMDEFLNDEDGNDDEEEAAKDLGEQQNNKPPGADLSKSSSHESRTVELSSDDFAEHNGGKVADAAPDSQQQAAKRSLDTVEAETPHKRRNLNTGDTANENDDEDLEAELLLELEN
ncbi:LAQU0S03e02300g1_1 [Lachancea quebecensis]|uniref:RNA polymerase II subunit A C-terminal domain phosphatase n=1 Tax=Lachancea quebecensis TaxID=1654605 RepID=A0A0P1KNQ6_9SACH|nr:LAQU0S03e02300g1_1 [Lachancea quebecensis]